MKLLLYVLVLVLFVSAGVEINAQTKLPAILSDNMCLQQNTEVNIWGWDSPGQKVTIKPSWGNESVTKANEKGRWLVKIKTPSAGEVGTVNVSGSSELTINNIAFGEVWLCSGQSNMERQLGFRNGQKPIVNFRQEAQEADVPNIRMFKVPFVASRIPREDCEGEWVECSRETVLQFSAVGYFYGKELHEHLSVPVGLIESARGGSPVESWTKKEDFQKTEYAHDDEAKHKRVAVLYNGMIAPLTNYTLKGVIWYQGEANVPNWKAYKKRFPNMISSWRETWGLGEFPFYFVQIAPNNYDDPFGQPQIVEAQCEALKLPNTGIAATQDIGCFFDIHPPHKKEVGRRLSLIALHKTYDKTEIVYSGPVLTSYEIEGQQIDLQFESPGSSLYSSGMSMSKIWAFYIAGADKVFYPAQGKQDGNSIRVYSPKVKHPVAVRYNWANHANATLYNKHGLPVLPFRTDDWDDAIYEGAGVSD